NRTSNIFMRDVVSGTTSLISVSTNGIAGNGYSSSATMTPDGRYVAFVSAAADLVTGDTNGLPDVFMRDTQTGTTVMASVGARSQGFVPNLGTTGSDAPEISADGRYIVFWSSASNLVSGVRKLGDIYVRDLIGGVTLWA